jgi:hypothetical protein
MFQLVRYRDIKPYIKTMEDKNISKVARGPNGFLTYYKNHPKLNEYWKNKRNNFIKRHLTQAINNNEDLNIYDQKDKISRRRLALLAWAY